MRSELKLVYMKCFICFLLLSANVCIAQNTAHTSQKPSATDCPTWDNANKPKSDVDFYKSLRSRKPVKKTPVNTATQPQKETQPLAETKTEVNENIEQPIDNTYTTKNKETDITTETESEKVKEKTKEKPKRLPARKTTKRPSKKATSCPNF